MPQELEIRRPDDDSILRKGDKVTLVYIRTMHTPEPIIVLTYVTKRSGDGKSIEVAFPNGVEGFSLDEEGFRWLRGHHTMESPEMQAMLTAKALR